MSWLTSGLISLLTLFLLGFKDGSKSPRQNLTYRKIIDSYNFVGDFSVKEETRQISDEIFWKYPMLLPPVDFPILYPLITSKNDYPATLGEGKPYDHLNRGRIYFLNGDFENARLTWLGAKKRFGTTFGHHRRNDYFISSAFLLKAKKELEMNNGEYEQTYVKSLFDAATAFLSYAFIVKEKDTSQESDPLINRVMPKGLYNLAAIYWKYGRFSGAFGAADSGLNYLRSTGKKDFRSEFYRILAESHIKNRSYFDAIQNLDLAIRQQSDPETAAASLTRAGDIYFDLNNYELAEDVYKIAAFIDEELKLVNSTQLVMRGEALFWLGEFSESQKILHFALHSSHLRHQREPLSYDLSGWASLRFADGYLARHEFDKARLEYYKVRSRFRSHLVYKIALIRENCLELPFYTGKNVVHARNLIEELKEDSEIPPVLRELAWSCQVASYTSRERTEEMLGRVRAFANEYPESKFLYSFVNPLTSYQRNQIQKYIDNNDPYSATEFYEKNKNKLFKTIEPEIGKFLFRAYLETQRVNKAALFWDYVKHEERTDFEILEKILFLQEYLDLINDLNLKRKIWAKQQEKYNILAIERRWNLEYSDKVQIILERLKRTKAFDTNIPWVFNLMLNWEKNNQNMRCDEMIPLLSQVLNSKVQHSRKGVISPNKIREILVGMTESQFPDLFKNDESCAMTVLELIAKVMRNDYQEIFNIIMTKSDWPLVAGYLNWVWIMSESMAARNMQNQAESIWNLIIQKAPDGTLEKKFAAQRLQKDRTEFETLWK